MNEWQKSIYLSKLKENILVITNENKCYKLTSDGLSEMYDLNCNQEEADGRMLLHAKHISESEYSNVVINSEDTDVFLLCLAFSSNIEIPIILRTSTKTQVILTDIQSIATTLGPNISSALLVYTVLLVATLQAHLLEKGKL